MFFCVPVPACSTHQYDSCTSSLRCLRYTKLCWVENFFFLLHNKCIPGRYYKPTNSPTQGQPNPRKIGSTAVAYGPLFPIANNFSCVGIGFIYGNRLKKKPNPTKILREHPVLEILSSVSNHQLDSTKKLSHLVSVWYTLYAFLSPQNPQQPGDRDHLETVCDETRTSHAFAHTRPLP